MTGDGATFNADELAQHPVFTVFNGIGMRHYTRTASVAVMHAYRCPRCQRDGLVRAETVVKGGAAKIEFYCGRCDYAWTRSTPVRTGTRDPRHA